MSKRIAVLVSGGGTNLQALIDAQGRGELVNGRISAVISSTPDAFALERAKNAGIPGYVLPRRDYLRQPRLHCRPDPPAAGDGGRPIWWCMAGFMTILTEELFQAYPNAVINIHPSLIPSFCGVGCYGLHVHEKALEYGVKISGATVHFVTRGVRRRPHHPAKGGWRCCPATRRRSSSGASWSSASGSCCPRPSPSSARTG